MNDFYSQFLLKNNIEVTDAPSEYPTYTPGYYAVFFNDPFTGIHFELSFTPLLPSPSSYMRWRNALKEVWAKHPEWKAPPWEKAFRKLKSRRDQAE